MPSFSLEGAEEQKKGDCTIFKYKPERIAKKPKTPKQKELKFHDYSGSLSSNNHKRRAKSKRPVSSSSSSSTTPVTTTTATSPVGVVAVASASASPTSQRNVNLSNENLVETTVLSHPQTTLSSHTTPHAVTTRSTTPQTPVPLFTPQPKQSLEHTTSNTSLSSTPHPHYHHQQAALADEEAHLKMQRQGINRSFRDLIPSKGTKTPEQGNGFDHLQHQDLQVTEPFSYRSPFYAPITANPAVISPIVKLPPISQLLAFDSTTSHDGAFRQVYWDNPNQHH